MNHPNEPENIHLVRLINDNEYNELNNLLNDNLDPNITINYNTTMNVPLLSIAANAGYIQIVKLLLDHGADPNGKFDDVVDDNNAQYMQLFCYPICCAFQKNYEDVAVLLINSGASISKRSGFIQFVSPKASDAFVKFLVDHVDIKHQFVDGTTWLHAAVYGNNLRLVRCLIDAGVDIDAKNSSDKTAVDIARDICNLDMVELIRSYDVPDKGVHE